jgi:uncharacterized RDD family membrane protein YckC
MWPFHRPAPDEHQHVCPVCGASAPRRLAVELYGHRVCRACQGAFANRRAAAWLLDRALFYAVAYGVYRGLSGRDLAAAQAAFVLLGWLAFAFRDGWRGRSPGKALLGLQVVADATGEPIDALRSFARNVVLFIPFAPLVAASQLAGGKRIGDGLAGTHVVWTRHARSRVFG